MEELSSFFLKSQRRTINNIILTFALAIITGALILMIPVMTRSGKISFIDALFTATSATCVTGLIVQDTATFFTAAGKSVILFLIQIGGLGIMTVTSFFALILGRKINLGDRFYIKTSFSINKKFSSARFFIIIALTTIIIELMGSLSLTAVLFFKYGQTIKNSFISGIFHSVSAFNNAGFSLYSNNLENFTGDAAFSITIMLLIVTGGIGFSVISEIMEYRRTKKISLHTKIVLFTTLMLIFVGALLFFLMEFKNPASIGNLSNKTKVLASFFQSITPRTAGYSTINMATLNEATLIILVVLMFIGASPGGTGGGIKTTTFASITLGGIYSLKGQKNITVFKKRIPQAIILRALTLTLTAIFLVLTASIIIMIIEKESFIKVIFEVTSAFGTVGLSTGITPELSTASKAILIFCMFIGRIGISVLSLAIASRVHPEKMERPEESISIG
ncbi:MAG: TrkH family potassium uptake protein [Actinomycetota bacterium]|nr:TrkH family potassium uptake protein [Actinomycetota bacterium]